MLFSGALSCLCALYVRRAGRAVGTGSLAVVLLSAGEWGLAYGLELAALTAEQRELWGSLKYIGICVLPAAWFVFALQYTGRERWVTASLLWSLAVVPTVVLTVMAIPHTRALVRSYPPGPVGAPVEVALGPLFWVFTSHAALLVVLSTGWLVANLLRLSPAYWPRSVLLIAAIAVVWMANLLTNLGIGVFRRIDPTPTALAIAGLLLIFGVFRFGLLDILPIARTSLVELLPDAVLVLDKYFRVIDINPAGVGLLGLPAKRLLGRRAQTLLHERILPAEASTTHPLDVTTHSFEVTLSGSEGEQHYDARLSPIEAGHEGLAGYLLVLRDITVRRRTERRLEYLAHNDPVTGLANRQSLMERLKQALADSRRDRSGLAVIFLDLDRFKVINDSLGHPAGDQVLVNVGERLRQVVREGDVLARFGGDEFCIVLPGVASAAEATASTERVLDAVRKPLRVLGEDMVVTGSAGVALSPSDGTGADILIARADAAMYAAKGRGPGNYEFASQLRASALTPLELEQHLRAALAQRRLSLVFQSIIDLRSGELFGLEALLRWRHPGRGFVPPSEFVPLADSIGLGRAMDQWVLTESCRQTQMLPKFLADQQLHFCVNVCPSTVAELPEVVSHVLAQTRVDPTLLVIEISERTVSEDLVGLSRTLTTIKQLGLSIALDDFGEGRTSIAQLHDLPLDFVKIDRSFVNRMVDRDGATLAVATVTQLAHAHGIRVVAEGIEDHQQRARLVELGCDLGQGFSISQPSRLADVIAPMRPDFGEAPLTQPGRSPTFG